MMRTILIPIAAAASALAIASPASAQWAPPPQQYGYGAPGYNQGYGYGAPGYNQGYGYGYGRDNYGGVRSLQARVGQLRQQIDNFHRRNIITPQEARVLRQNVRQLDWQLARASRNGLTQREASAMHHRIAVVETRIHAEARDGRGGYGYGRDDRGYGYYDGRRGRDDDRRGRRDRDDDDRWDDRD